MTALLQIMMSLPIIGRAGTGTGWRFDMDKYPDIFNLPFLFRITILIVYLVLLVAIAAWAAKYWSRLWTITRLTVLQAIRMKVAVVLILFTLSLVAVLPFLLKTDDTPYGQIRVAITYTVYTAQFLLCVLTLFLATATLCSEFKGKQIYSLDSKPVPRWCVLTGKWLGVMVINVALLAGVGGILYGIVRYQARMPEVGRVEVTEEMPEFVQMQIAGVRQSNEILRAQVLRARVMREPTLPDGRHYTDLVRQRAAVEMEERREAGTLPDNRSEEWIFDALCRRINNEVVMVAPGNFMQWRIDGLPTDLRDDDYVTLRFHIRGVPRPPGNEIVGFWQMGRYDPERERFTGPVYAENPYQARAWLCDQAHSVTVPARVVDPEEGALTVRFYNMTEGGRSAAVFPATDGIRLYVPVGGFEVNLIRGLALVFVKLAYLAVLGLVCASFLTFPVASFTAFSLFLISLAGGYLYDLVGKVHLFGTGLVRPGTPMEEGDEVVQWIMGRALMLFPDLGSYDPVPFLTDGQAVPWGLVGYAAFTIVGIYSVILAVIGGFIFHRREVAGLD